MKNINIINNPNNNILNNNNININNYINKNNNNNNNYNINNHNQNNNQNNNDNIINIIKPQINKVSNRFLGLSPSVKSGLEPEPKKTDFNYIKDLGSGSFGRVFLVMHKKTKCQYALKIINKQNKSNIEGQPYFKREIEIMYKLHHQNCVRLFGNFEDENYCYFIMEYVSNGNLYTLLKKNNNLDIKFIAHIMKDLISAVYYLHSKKPPIIHRDIKPENALLSETNELKLTDFGWSNYVNYQGDVRNTFCGTPIYLAPEMIRNQGHDEHVDIWCIGVLLFELIVGKPPFFGNNREMLMSNICNVRISWPNNKKIDPDAKDLICKILVECPENRPTLKEIIAHNFFKKFGIYEINKNERLEEEIFVVSRDIPNKNFSKNFNNNYNNSYDSNINGLYRNGKLFGSKYNNGYSNDKNLFRNGYGKYGNNFSGFNSGNNLFDSYNNTYSRNNKFLSGGNDFKVFNDYALKNPDKYHKFKKAYNSENKEMLENFLSSKSEKEYYRQMYNKIPHHDREKIKEYMKKFDRENYLIMIKDKYLFYKYITDKYCDKMVRLRILSEDSSNRIKSITEKNIDKVIAHRKNKSYYCTSHNNLLLVNSKDYL